jgi:hypothetical protein
LTATVRTRPAFDRNPLSRRFDPDLIAATLVAMPGSEFAVHLMFGECDLFKNFIPWLYAVHTRAFEFVGKGTKILDVYVRVARATFNYANFVYLLPFLPEPIDSIRAMPYPLRRLVVERLNVILSPLEPDENVPRKLRFFDENTTDAFRGELRGWLAENNLR